MRPLYIVLIAAIFYSPQISAGQQTLVADTVIANPADVQSIDAIIAALYNVISGPAGKNRDWNRMRSLFLPEGKLVATAQRATGEVVKRTMTVEDYIATSGPVLEKNSFFEKEVSRKQEVYGHIAHCFSTYESKRSESDEKPFMRGINSIQLYHDGKDGGYCLYFGSRRRRICLSLHNTSNKQFVLHTFAACQSLHLNTRFITR